MTELSYYSVQDGEEGHTGCECETSDDSHLSAAPQHVLGEFHDLAGLLHRIRGLSDLKPIQGNKLVVGKLGWHDEVRICYSLQDRDTQSALD